MSLRAKRGPESVSLLLWDGRRVLLVRRGRGGLFPSTWTLPGREIGRGEPAEAAALAAANELLGVHTSHLRLLRDLSQPSPFRDERGPDSVFQVMTWEGEPSEGETRRWFNLEELAEIRIFREARDTLRAVCATLPATQTAEVGR